jgi:hypothetical protein
MPTDTNQTIQDSRKAAMSFLDAAKKKEEDRGNRTSTYTRGGSRKKVGAVDGFLSAGRRNEARAVAAKNGEESDFDLAWRISRMSDEDFDKAVVDGTLTPEQIRRAGEYEYDTYMGDVWTEQDENFDKPEPTYEEFMSDPAKYGAEDIDDPEFPRRFSRYNPARYQKQ